MHNLRCLVYYYSQCPKNSSSELEWCETGPENVCLDVDCITLQVRSGVDTNRGILQAMIGRCLVSYWSRRLGSVGNS